ncbi:hypothetical protein HYH03_005246 [Edaphochlamys debaryana]|uniref:Protein DETOXIFICATION n=1 Tax=Edaphochlamys debaryana TaxID=47281 RepID=A0A836C1F0_9CHLO|nr:hypothetical protein HYH03_005246 [Edaphochlamys debaryana]|eukprot:KAG2496841.1 hypothetical protein HYH03_005246 [Edaphochlamys debaryana]
MVYNLTGLSWTSGLTGGISTLCGQVYGAGKYGSVGVIFQRALIICLLCGLPAYLSWLWAANLFTLLGQTTAVATLAAGYLHRVAPCMALGTAESCIRSYFFAQGNVTFVSVTTLVGIIASPWLNWYFISGLGWGLYGKAWAQVVEGGAAVILLAGAMVYQTWRTPPELRTWSGWDRAAFKGWGEYLKVSLPATAMVCVDWWALEVLTLMSGIGANTEAEVAATGALYSMFLISYNAVDGFSSAASTRIGHMLGAGRASAARRAAAVSFAAAMALTLLISIGTVVGAPLWIPAFSANDPLVHALIVSTLPYTIFASMGYAAYTALTGVLSGAGRQGLGTVVSVTTVWGVGVPVAALTVLGLGWGIQGQWLGCALAYGLQGIALLWCIFARWDWSEEVRRAASAVSLHSMADEDSISEGDCETAQCNASVPTSHSSSPSHTSTDSEDDKELLDEEEVVDEETPCLRMRGRPDRPSERGYGGEKEKP